MFVGGDIHGNFKYLLTLISGYNLRDCNIVICGDCGFGFTPYKNEVATVKYLNQSFIARKNHLYLCRGNHDDPKYWAEENLSKDNVHFVSDYSVLQIENNNILFLGGAISIDRIERKVDKSYWAKEPFVLDLEKLNSLINITWKESQMWVLTEDTVTHYKYFREKSSWGIWQGEVIIKP